MPGVTTVSTAAPLLQLYTLSRCLVFDDSKAFGVKFGWPKGK